MSMDKKTFLLNKQKALSMKYYFDRIILICVCVAQSVQYWLGEQRLKKGNK